MKQYYDNSLLGEIEYNLCNEKYELAKSQIDDYIKMYPDDGMIKVCLMKYYNNTMQFQEACNYGYEQIGVKFRDNIIFSKIYKEFAKALANLDRIDEAIDYLEYAIAQTNGEISMLISEVARLYSKNNEHDKAIEILNKHINYRNESEFYICMSKIYLVNQEYQLCLDTAFKANDSNLKANQQQKKYYIIAQAYYSSGDLENALKSFKKVLTIKNAKFYIAYYTIAKIYYLQGKYQETAKICEELLKTNHGGADVKSLLADTYRALENPLGMINASKYMSPKEDEYRNGIFCIEQLDYLSAITHFNKYLQAGGKKYEEEVLFLIILSKFKLGKYRECLDDIYAYNPSDDRVNDIARMKYYCKCVLNEVDQDPSYTSKQVEN